MSEKLKTIIESIEKLSIKHPSIIELAKYIDTYEQEIKTIDKIIKNKMSKLEKWLFKIGFTKLALKDFKIEHSLCSYYDHMGNMTNIYKGNTIIGQVFYKYSKITQPTETC